MQGSTRAVFEAPPLNYESFMKTLLPGFNYADQSNNIRKGQNLGIDSILVDDSESILLVDYCGKLALKKKWVSGDGVPAVVSGSLNHDPSNGFYG